MMQTIRNRFLFLPLHNLPLTIWLDENANIVLVKSFFKTILNPNSIYVLLHKVLKTSSPNSKGTRISF